MKKIVVLFLVLALVGAVFSAGCIGSGGHNESGSNSTPQENSVQTSTPKALENVSKKTKTTKLYSDEYVDVIYHGNDSKLLKGLKIKYYIVGVWAYKLQHENGCIVNCDWDITNNKVPYYVGLGYIDDSSISDKVKIVGPDQGVGIAQKISNLSQDAVKYYTVKFTWVKPGNTAGIGQENVDFSGTNLKPFAVIDNLFINNTPKRLAFGVIIKDSSKLIGWIEVIPKKTIIRDKNMPDCIVKSVNVTKRNPNEYDYMLYPYKVSVVFIYNMLPSKLPEDLQKYMGVLLLTVKLHQYNGFDANADDLEAKGFNGGFSGIKVFANGSVLAKLDGLLTGGGYGDQSKPFVYLGPKFVWFGSAIDWPFGVTYGLKCLGIKKAIVDKVQHMS